MFQVLKDFIANEDLNAGWVSHQSFKPNPTGDSKAEAIYNTPGTYLVTLVVTDSSGWSDTLRQFIVKLSPCSSLKLKSKPYSSLNNNSWEVLPNPSSGNISLYFNSSWAGLVSIELYSVDGSLLMKKSFESGSIVLLDLADIPKGLYLLHATDGILTSTKKIILAN